MPQRLELQGQRFGRLVALKDVGERHGYRVWLCKCDCGNHTEVVSKKLKSGWTKSCGCYKAERASEANRTHGMRDTSEYNTWNNMRQRCSNSNDKSYHNYGGRGIQVCPKWQESFEAFYADMGKRPTPNHTIDRIDNDGDYEPENCRWATRKKQMRNTRRTRFVTHNGQTKCITDWATELEIPLVTLWRRLNDGWTIDKCLSHYY